MGKGGLNRLLLSLSDSIGTDPHATGYQLSASDPRAAHICTLLAHAPTFTLRVAVQPATLHDCAVATVLDDGGVQILVPHDTSRDAPPPPSVALVVAMQRPKVIGRVLEAAAAVGVCIICVIAAEKVEKSYWDCKLFRDDLNNGKNGNNRKSAMDEDEDVHDDAKSNSHDGAANSEEKKNKRKGDTTDPQESDTTIKSNQSGVSLPGRPRGERNHPHRDRCENRMPAFVAQRRVDQVPSVKRRLVGAVQQASADATAPIVLLERRGLKAVLDDPSHILWQHVPRDATRVVAHPYRVGNAPVDAISRTVANGLSDSAILAIGPEGGWVQEELELFASSSFSFASLGERVLRSETATIVSLGLVHEGLRLRQESNGKVDEDTMAS